MSVNGKYKNFTIDDVFQVADRFGIGEAKQLIIQIREAIKSWPIFAKKAGLNKQEIARVGKLHLLF
jgi:serine/threonine-protein kinase HipA